MTKKNIFYRVDVMDIKLLSGALGAEINGIDLKDTSVKNFKKSLISCF